LPGSVCRYLVRHSPTPVVVVPDRHRTRNPESSHSRVGGPA
jgi:hypothetical protein